MSIREEIDLEKTEQIVGGCYVTSDMSIDQIIGTDRQLAGILAQAGISAIGSKAVKNATLYEIAQVSGVNADALVNRMNEYLDGK